MIRDEELEINRTQSGRVEYFYKGKRHRDEGPAVIFSTGTQHWYQHGRHHREGGPAIIRYDKRTGNNIAIEEIWLRNGVRHRTDGPARIRHPHRIEEPADIYHRGAIYHRRAEVSICGRKEYWFEGKLHREDGPAIIDERSGNEWYLHGIKVSKKDFKKALNCPLVELPLLLNAPLEPLAAKRLAQEF